MSDEHTREEISSEPASILQSRPQRRSRPFKPGLAILLSLLGGVVIVGVVYIIAWHSLSPASIAVGSNGGSNSKGSNNSSSVPPGWNDPATYWNPIRTTVAHGLHLSVDQVKTKLQAATPAGAPTSPSSNKNNSNTPDPTVAMTTVAVQQGLSTDQLRTLELNALQNGCNAMVAQGELSQVDADQRMQIFNGWDQRTLNWYIMHGFTGQ